MTLPLIYTLNHCSKKDKREIINVVKNHNENKIKVFALINKVKSSGGIEYTEKKMIEYKKDKHDKYKNHKRSSFSNWFFHCVYFYLFHTGTICG